MNNQNPTLAAVCRTVGLSAKDAELIRAGENMLYRLPGRVVARVTRSGQLDAATKETWTSTVGLDWGAVVDSREAFPSLRILSGVEVSEPHWHSAAGAR